MTPTQRAAVLAENLRGRRAWYERLAEMAREQKRLIEESPDELPAFVEKKRAVMVELERLAEAAPGLRQEWEALRPELSAAEAAAVEEELAGVARVLEAIMKAEEESRAAALKARAVASDELRTATDVRRAAGAYRPPPPAAPARFVDRTE